LIAAGSRVLPAAAAANPIWCMGEPAASAALKSAIESTFSMACVGCPPYLQTVDLDG